MKTMEDYMVNYQKRHRGKGTTSKLTDYSFTWTELLPPNEKEKKPKETVFFLSYFTEV